MAKKINIRDVQPGMVIVRVTEQNGPVKIKKAGLVSSQAMVQGLIEMGIQTVEIDPDQTVEVEAPKVKKSATRKMLESNKVTNARTDDGLSDQFHRSLFLPSVQDIPSAWQFYAKRYLVVAFIAAGGLCLGWSLANYHMFIEWVSLSVKEPVVVQQVPAAEVDSSANETLTAEKNTTEPPPETIIEPNSSSANITQRQGIQPTILTAEDSVVNAEVQQIAEPDVPIPVIQEPAVKVSPDLLKRFQKAISEVEFEPASSSAAQEPNVGYSNDTDASNNEGASSNQQVARIDQLPAWVMTRLPSMSFSAHMYASEESERWVRVNGTRMMEGDLIDSEVEIVRIEAQHVILRHSGQEFSMAALTDW